MRIYVNESGSVRMLDALDRLQSPETGVVWVELQAPADQELDAVGEYFQIHPLALEDCQLESHLPKVQEFDNHLFVIWNMLRDNPSTERIEMESLGIFVGTDYIVTIHNSPMGELEAVIERFLKEPDFYSEHPAKILYSILDNSVDDYFPLVEELTDSIDTYMENLITEDGVGELRTILVLKHRNMSLRRVVGSHRDVVVKLMRRDMPFVPDNLSIYFLDVYDHLVRVGTSVDSNSDLISSSLDIRLNTVSNRLNVTMKRLTTIATIFLPLTFLVGFYGMNFEHMPELGSRAGYPAAVIVMLLICVALHRRFRRVGWL